MRFPTRAVALLSLATLLAGCDGGRPDAQFAPSLPPAAGFRVDDGRLEVWTGRPCRGITGVRFTFDQPSADAVPLVLDAREGPVTVERLDPERPGPGLSVTEPLPAGFDWRDAETVGVLLYGADARWSSVVDVSEVVRGSPEHPPDTFYFDEAGWLDAAGVAAEDGKSFLTVCTPDPARE